MNLRQILSILRARQRLALSIFVLVVATVVAVSLLLPKQYVGSASVVVDVKPDPVTALASPVAALPAFMATQVDILTSDRVTLRVIRSLKLTEVQQVRDDWLSATGGEGSLEQWLVKLVQKRLDVKPSRESNVITVNYKGPSPEFAAEMANAFARAYIATTLELRADPARQYSSFFSDQARTARETLERAQARLSAFQRAKGIVASEERMDVETARLNELSSQLVQIQSIVADSASRQSAAQGTKADRTQEVLANPLISGMKAELTRSEARLQELIARYGEKHPQVIEARANIAELRQRLDGETRRVTEGTVVSTGINRQRESQLRRELEAQRAKVLQLKAVRDEGQVLMRDVEVAQRAFETLANRQSQTAVESQANQSYVNMLTVAEPPVEADSPRLLLNTVLAVFFGALFAVGGALVVELNDRRVRIPADVVEALQLPLLGILPAPGAKRFSSGRAAVQAAPRAPAFSSADALQNA